jgi:RNA methyltransferase, TrmH family
MISKNEAKYIQSLFHKKTREAEGVFVVEGPKLLEEVLASGYVTRKVYATGEWVQPVAKSIDLVNVSEDELQRISGLQTAHEVLAVVEQKKNDTVPVFKGKLSIALDNIQDPGNLGTIIRIADWFGVKQVIASNGTVELYNPKVIQSTMGSFVRVEMWYDDIAETLKNAGVPVYGALLNGRNVLEMKKINEGVLVIGNESKGLSDEVKRLITEPITIPRFGGAESLNAAVATGIILSHIVA